MKYIRVFRIPAIRNHDVVKLNYSRFQILTKGFNILQYNMVLINSCNPFLFIFNINT